MCLCPVLPNLYPFASGYPSLTFFYSKFVGWYVSENDLLARGLRLLSISGQSSVLPLHFHLYLLMSSSSEKDREELAKNKDISQDMFHIGKKGWELRKRNKEGIRKNLFMERTMIFFCIYILLYSFTPDLVRCYHNTNNK